MLKVLQFSLGRTRKSLFGFAGSSNAEFFFLSWLGGTVFVLTLIA